MRDAGLEMVRGPQLNAAVRERPHRIIFHAQLQQRRRRQRIRPGKRREKSEKTEREICSVPLQYEKRSFT
jgi:hypothetical protein